MKYTAAAIVLSCLSLVGCVRSLHPAYLDEQVEFDPKFVGAWTNEDGGRAELTAADGERSYRVTFTDKEGKTSRLVAHFVKVGDLLIVDFTADEAALPDDEMLKVHVAPLHTFWRVDNSGDTLALRGLSHEWLKKLLHAQPDAIAHQRRDDEVLLTAPTDALQAFILKHADDPEAWTEPSVFRRAAPPATKPSDKESKAASGDAG